MIQYLLKTIALSLMLFWQSSATLAQNGDQIHGDPEAIAAANAMVEQMGGKQIWAELRTLEFEHIWHTVNRLDDYHELEVLDLAHPRSFVLMESEITRRARGYSPEHGYWVLEDGTLNTDNEARLASAIARSPFNIYRLARGIARGDRSINVSLGTIEGLPALPALIFHDAEGEPGAWIMLNAQNEPQIWKTRDYLYVLGPMEQYGNLRIPAWATTADGLIQYEMVALKGSKLAPPLELFAPQREIHAWPSRLYRLTNAS